MKEIHTPAGYRTIDQVELYFCESIRGEVLLLSNSIWDKGAYAMPKVTVAASGSIKLLENNQIIELEDDPLMFAVVYQKQGKMTGVRFTAIPSTAGMWSRTATGTACCARPRQIPMCSSLPAAAPTR